MTEVEQVLSDEDEEFLVRKGWTYEVKPVQAGPGRELLITVRNFALPEKYRPRVVDLLVRQLPGYPETGMDMFWTRPDVVLAATGQKPDRADHVETYGDLPWQRWSRHWNGWRSQVDNLETFFAAIQKELNK